MIKEIQETNDYDKAEEYNEMRQSILDRIDEIDKFFELNFDKPYAFHFEKGRIRLKKLLMFEPDLVNQLDNGKEFKGLAFGLRNNDENNMNTENYQERTRTPYKNSKANVPPLRMSHINRSVEKNSNNYRLNTKSDTSNGTGSVPKYGSTFKYTKQNTFGGARNLNNNLRNSNTKPIKKSNTMGNRDNNYAFKNKPFSRGETRERGYSGYNPKEDYRNQRGYDEEENEEDDDEEEFFDGGNQYDYNVIREDSNYETPTPKEKLRSAKNRQRSTGDYQPRNQQKMKNKFSSSSSIDNNPEPRERRRNKVVNLVKTNNNSMGGAISFKPDTESDRYGSKSNNAQSTLSNKNQETFRRPKELNEDEDEESSYAKDDLKEIVFRFKLSEEEYRLLLREKAKIVVQLPSERKSNNTKKRQRK